MSIEIVVEPEFSHRVVRSRLREIALRTLRAEKVSINRDVVIAVVGDKAIRRLNRQFHGVDAPTDVLSFPSGAHQTLGDIVISYETARASARKAHWRTRDELDLLIVHGILHLLGYDDIDLGDRARMWKRQEKIMGRKIDSGF